jgi:hypothetical protein
VSQPSPTPPVAATYRELLLPSWPVWATVIAVSGSLGLVFLKTSGALAALLVAGVVGALAVVALLRSSARIEVAGGELRAGRAHMPVSLLGRVRVVSAPRMAALRGPQADARAYLCQRAWIREGVLVENVDPADPVPYWLISSRTPQRLSAALLAAGAGGPAQPPSKDPGQGQAHSRQTG